VSDSAPSKVDREAHSYRGKGQEERKEGHWVVSRLGGYVLEPKLGGKKIGHKSMTVEAKRGVTLEVGEAYLSFELHSEGSTKHL